MQCTCNPLLFKTVVIGESGVGKTNLITRYALDEFNAENLATVGVEFMTKAVKVGDVEVRAQIWDTAGQERFRSLVKTIYYGAKGAMVVYDITSQASFDNVRKWLDELVTYVPANAFIMLVGNKNDLEHLREVKKEVGQKFAEDHGLMFLETPALAASNVEAAFAWLMRQILQLVPIPELSQGAKPEHCYGHPIILDPAPPPRKIRQGIPPCGC